jgi:hypothetical protein
MNQTLVAVLAVASFVLAVDLFTTYLRKRARSKSVTPRPPLMEEQSRGESKREVAIEYE